jgi:hypothetical protein
MHSVYEAVWEAPMYEADVELLARVEWYWMDRRNLDSETHSVLNPLWEELLEEES